MLIDSAPKKNKNYINSCNLQMIVSAAWLVFPLLVVIGQGACLAWAPVKLLDERGWYLQLAVHVNKEMKDKICLMTV